MTMFSGNYYVGDLCYVLNEEWDEVCDLLFAGRTDGGCNEGEFNLKDGRRFAIFNTAYGDGTYKDQLGRKYNVDAGSIGCILMDDIDLLDDRNFISGGQTVVMPSQFNVYSEDGVLCFGSIEIDTDPEYDEEYDGQPDEAQEWNDFDPDC